MFHVKHNYNTEKFHVKHEKTIWKEFFTNFYYIFIVFLVKFIEKMIYANKKSSFFKTTFYY